MQVNPLTLTTTNPATAATLQTLRLVSGDIAQIQTGVTVAASVLRIANGEATLNIGGNPVTVRAPIGLSAGDVLSVRSTGGQTPTLELIGRAVASTPAPTVPQAVPDVLPSRVSVVDVLAKQTDGTFRVSIDGGETIATSSEPLVPGGRYIVQIDRTPAGIVLTPVPDSPNAPTTLASAILRGERPPPLGETAPSLLRELDSLPLQLAKSPAVVQTREALEAILPNKVKAPTAEQLQAVVERGGEQFEANLARRSLGERVPLNTDLKGGILRLMQTVPDIVAALPSARPTLDGIEARQAAQVLAQEHGGPYVFQVPYVDGPNWRTVRLAIEPEGRNPDSPDDSPRGFRVMMHVPSDTLGEIWLDAQAIGSSLRAMLYITESAAIEGIRSNLPELRTELQTAGFADVLLDVRSAQELTDRQKRKVNAMTAGVPESVGVLDVRA